MISYSNLENSRVPTTTFPNYRANENTLLRLLSMMFDECFGDSCNANIWLLHAIKLRREKE